MLGLSVASGRPCVSPVAPRRGFWPRQINAPEGAPRCDPEGAGVSERPFTRPQRLPLFGASSAGSAFLACPFGALQLAARTRSASGSPPRGAFAARGGSTPEARCPDPQAVIPLPPQALLPVGIFRSLRFIARPDLASGSSPGQLRLPSSLPGSAFLAAGVSGSSLRGSRAASSSLFRGPLGTIPIVQRAALRCQAPRAEKAQIFRNYIIFFFKWLREHTC